MFRISGGKAPKRELGLGHIFRCLSLAEQLKFNQLFFALEDFGGAQKIIRKEGHQNIFKLGKDIGVAADIRTTSRIIHKEKVDILIVDKYNVSQKYLKKLIKHVKVVLVSDLKNIDFPADLVINGFIGFENKIVKNRFGTKCLLGPAYQILSNNFLKKTPKMRNFDLLATFGGFDENNIIETLLKELLHFRGKIRTKIILGPATKKTSKIRSFEKKLGNSIKIIQHTDNMFKEMADSKNGLCAGGITTYEFAALKIPFVIICQVKHQLKTAQEWNKRKLAHNMGLFNKNTGKKINDFLYLVAEEKIVYKMKKKSPVDGFGTNRVVKEIMKIR